MGVPVSNLEDFKEKLNRFSGRSVIFGFLLFDSRPSQKAIDEFARQQAQWIDELARGAGIYFFFPLHREGSDFKNPSTQLMRMFGFGISRLPGIILFAPVGEEQNLVGEKAIYIPLQERDFDDKRTYEPLLLDLFELIGKNLAAEKNSDAVLENIRSELAKLRRKRTRRGFANYLRKGAHLVLFKIPSSVCGPFAEGFGKALGQRAAGM